MRMGCSARSERKGETIDEIGCNKRKEALRLIPTMMSEK
jgi:hypothetical protein